MPGDAAEGGTEPGGQPQVQVEGLQVEAGADSTATEAGAAEVAIEAGTTPDPWALGHVVLAPDAPVAASFLLLLALAAGVGASVVGLGLALVRRGVGAELNKRAVAVVIGLAIAILAFPGAANELGAAAFEGSQASLRVLPASVDVGLRCAFADAPTQSADGCATRGALALPRYLADGFELVLSEARLARPGVAITQAQRRSGLKRAWEEQRWGIDLVPFTAAAWGEDSPSRPASELDLSTLVLLVGVALLAASAWYYLRKLLTDADGLEAGASEQRSRIMSTRLKNIALFAVLGVGAYLSFAALTALGPFMEARRIAQRGGLITAAEHLDRVDADWQAARLVHELPEDSDLVELERALPRFASLRREALTRSFDLLATRYNSFEATYDRAYQAAGQVGAPSRKELEATGRTRNQARQLATWVEATHKPMREAFKLANTVRTVTGDQDAADKLALLNRFRATLAALEDTARQVQEATQGEAPALLPADAAPLTRALNEVYAALQTYQKDLESAQQAFATAETVISDENAAALAALQAHRASRWQLRQDLVQIDRAFASQRLLAAEQVAKAKAEFSSVQRAGPGWLDRMEAAASWYEQSFRQSQQGFQDCADTVLARGAADRRAVRITLQALPVNGDGTPIPVQQLTASLDRFASAIRENGTEDGAQEAAGNTDAVTRCLATASATEPLQPRASVGTRYGTTIGLMSGWLMKSGSLDIVMIAGMLGFGLLGAGLSRVVRRRLSAEEEARVAPAPTSAPPLVEDVPSIVFQGLGATLIVYLAGVGGLGAVSTTAPELDPYVLMLGCFTAAVFSDDVWRWARDWVQKQRPLG